MNNETFSLNRFWNLLKKDFRAMWPRYGVGMIIMACFTLVLWLLVLLFSQWTAEGISHTVIDPLIRLFVIGFGASLAAMLAPAKLYGEVNNGKRGYYFAQLPASKLEKYLSMLVHCLVVVPLVVLLGGMVVDTLLWALPFGSYHDALWVVPEWMHNTHCDFEDMGYESLRFVLFITNPMLWIVMWLNSMVPFLFTNTIFKKNKFIRTILWLWLIGFALQLICTPIFIHLRLTDWMALYFDHMEDITIDDFIRFLNIHIYAITLPVTLFFYWWTGRRLYKMKY